jgi:hypothetical protein
MTMPMSDGLGFRERSVMMVFDGVQAQHTRFTQLQSSDGETLRATYMLVLR